MTNREKLYEIAGRLSADADLAVVRAALLALIRVLLGACDGIAWLKIGAVYACKTCGAKAAAVGDNTWDHPDVGAKCIHSAASLGRGYVSRVSCAIDDILRERDAMVARSRRGSQRDDEKTPEDWAGSLRKVSDPAHPIVSYDAPWTLRRIWVQIGAVALRAVESIDRRAAPYEKTRSELAGKGIHMAPIGGWPHQREDEPQEPGK